MKLRDLTGLRYGRLRVMNMDRRANGGIRWWCKCDCGTTKSILGSNLRRTMSCGCYQKEDVAKRFSEMHRTHGLSDTQIYRLWRNMLDRCYNAKSQNYVYYGGRGISVCAAWHRFDAFYHDIGQHRKPGTSIDRIDPNGDYEPSNCRWATPKEQSANRRDAIRLVYQGESKNIIDWCKHFGISEGAFRHARLKCNNDRNAALRMIAATKGAT